MSSPAEIDHHAFLFDPRSGSVIIPVNQNGAGHLLVFHYDGGTTISYLGQTNETANVERGLLIDDTLYSIAHNSVRAYELSDLAQSIGSVALTNSGFNQGAGSGFDYTNPNLVQYNEAWGTGYGGGWGRGFEIGAGAGAAAVPIQVIRQPVPAADASLQPVAAPRRLVPAGTNILATGSDAGVSPQVNVYNADSESLLFSLTPFDPNFTGGVRVAVGDVNGDATPDILCAAGTGGGPNVVVFNGKDGSQLYNFFAFDAAFTGGVTIAAGDVDGDGFADIICGADQGGGPNVSVFSGKDGSRLTSFFAYDPAFTGGVRVASGDVTGTGVDAIICGAGLGGGPNVTIFTGTGTLVSSFFAFDPLFTGGIYATGGNIDGSGQADIITGAGPGGGANVATFSLSFSAGSVTENRLASVFLEGRDFAGGLRLTAFTDGSGRPRVLGVASPDGAPVVTSFDPLTGAAVDHVFDADVSTAGGLFVAGMR